MTIKVLCIGDVCNNITMLKKFSKELDITIINFPKKGASVQTYSDDGLFFDSLLISKQVKKIINIKDDFDLCITPSWAGARIAYLVGLNYIMYFVGNDIRTPPFEKDAKDPYLNKPLYNYNFLERMFYKNILDGAVACVAWWKGDYEALKKYRKDAIKLETIPVDTDLYNDNVKPFKKNKSKFVFFSPQRFGIEKGMDIIWKALPLCKSDFEVHQVDWIDERTDEEKQINKKLFENRPHQVKLIPLIRRENMANYYKFADAVLGQMRSGGAGGVEREACFCKKPLVHYCDKDLKYEVNGEVITPPFFPKTQNPEDLAKILDQIVTSESFRNDLIQNGYKFAKKIADPYKNAEEWEQLVKKIHSRFMSINKNQFNWRKHLMLFTTCMAENFVYKRKMKNKNIQGWGKEEYKRLTK